MIEVLLGVAVFTCLIVTLATVIQGARTLIMRQGEVAITINGSRTQHATVGRTLLAALAESGINLPGPCGGRGTCGQCRVRVRTGGDKASAVEAAILSPAESRTGVHLACQITLRKDLSIELPAEIFAAQHLVCRVLSNRGVATLMREIVLQLPDDAVFDFRAGAYVQLHCPQHRTRFADFEIEPRFRTEWERSELLSLEAEATEPQVRAYSLADEPGGDTLRLIVRIALPRPGSGHPPGQVSSWLFALGVGDRVKVSGPFGSFAADNGSNEMIIVGGGAGMAPLRSIIRDQLLRQHSGRSISFWYGARNRRELVYADEFDALDATHSNFHWTPALSEPETEEDWQGATGFVHEVLLRGYLSDHPDPTSCQYYLCGPPLMISAVLAMLSGLGVTRDNIHFDDFGS